MGSWRSSACTFLFFNIFTSPLPSRSCASFLAFPLLLTAPPTHFPNTMQDVINASFSAAASTEHALLLLRQFEALLQWDSFRADLDAK